jgi:hypothetical protein
MGRGENVQILETPTITAARRHRNKPAGKNFDAEIFSRTNSRHPQCSAMKQHCAQKSTHSHTFAHPICPDCAGRFSLLAISHIREAIDAQNSSGFLQKFWFSRAYSLLGGAAAARG